MSTIKLNWGVKIGILYGAFMLLIATLVIGSMRQDFDLVSKDYYEQELAYQEVIDASKNQSTLSAPVTVHADEEFVNIDFPAEFKESVLSGDVQFYSQISSAWDKFIPVKTVNNSMAIPRSTLASTVYQVKIRWNADGKTYYQQSEIKLSK